MTAPQIAAHTIAARTPPCRTATVSRITAPITAPAALALNSTVYQTSASSEPCWCAYSGIWAWNAVPTKNDVAPRSEEHTSELQSQSNLVCRLLLEKKKHRNPLC